jgi:hypothetical protein
VRLLAAVAALLCILETGCDLLNQNGGADASCEGGPTLGDQCNSVYTTLCAQAGRCNLPADPSCVAGTVSHCPCSVENCDASSCTTQSYVAACQSDLGSEDCNAIVNYTTPGYWPSSCTPFMGQQ